MLTGHGREQHIRAVPGSDQQDAVGQVIDEVGDGHGGHLHPHYVRPQGFIIAAEHVGAQELRRLTHCGVGHSRIFRE